MKERVDERILWTRPEIREHKFHIPGNDGELNSREKEGEPKRADDNRRPVAESFDSSKL